MTTGRLASSRALWNRSRLALESDETIAQILDRGDLDDWRSLYAEMRHDPGLRARMRRILARVPLPLPHFWLAALSALGEDVDWSIELPDYYDGTSI
jgi:hypothetical protein